MFSTQPHEPQSSAPPPPGGEGEDQAALTLARLAELDRLRNFSFAQAERLMELPKVVPVEEARRMFGKKGTIQQFDRITRAFRQIVVLEYELRGLFNAPDRDAIHPLRLARPPKDPFDPETLKKLLADLHGKQNLSSLKTRTDYRTGPIEDVVAGIRKALGAEAPQNDPFAPRKDRPARPVQPAPASRRDAPPKPAAAAKPGPATVKLPEKPQVNPAFEAAMLALQAKFGNGFRIPPAKPKTAKANPARPPKRRRNRGPPK
jgi:hypothetical protein